MSTTPRSNDFLALFCKAMTTLFALLALSACQDSTPKKTTALEPTVATAEEQPLYELGDTRQMVVQNQQLSQQTWQETLDAVSELTVTPEVSAALLQELAMMKAAWGNNNRILDGFRKLYADGSELNLSAVGGKVSTAIGTGAAVAAITMKSELLPDLQKVYRHLTPGKIGLGLGSIAAAGVGGFLLQEENPVFGSNTELTEKELNEIRTQIELAQAKNSQFAERIADFTNVLYNKGVLVMPETHDTDDSYGY